MTSVLKAAMFSWRDRLCSVHWVHEANRNLASSRCYSDFTIDHHSWFCEANRNMVPGSLGRAKIRDVTQWTLYKSIPPKKHGGVQTWRHFRRLELILTANIPSHLCHETIYRPTVYRSTIKNGQSHLQPRESTQVQRKSRATLTWQLTASNQTQDPKTPSPNGDQYSPLTYD